MNKLKWEEFKEQVSSFMGLNTEEVLESTNLYDDLGIDSLGIFSLGMHLTKTYEVKVPLSEVANIETVGDLYALVCKFS